MTTALKQSAVGMLRLSVRPGHPPDYIRRASITLQALPGVLRVRVEQASNEIEIIFHHPTEGLLRSVHQALRQAGSEIIAGKAF